MGLTINFIGFLEILGFQKLPNLKSESVCSNASFGTTRRFNRAKIDRLMENEGIIRARAKIEATTNGARVFNEMQKNGEDFSDFCWSFTNGKVLKGDGLSVPVSSELSKEISKQLKKRGFKFCGPTIVYAWMQAIGMVNDHSTKCFRR
jgi:DNA-3-methyladenine glycosylase I